MTKQEILDRLLAMFPEFGPFWDSDDNSFRDDDGTFTRCGAFAQFSHFFRARYEQFPQSRLVELGVFVTECASSGDTDLRGAVAGCFLENIEDERFSSDFKQYLSGEARRLFSG